MDSVEQKKQVKVAPKKPTTAALRVSNELRKKVIAELARLNKKPFGKRIKFEAYLQKAMGKMTTEDFEELQTNSLSNQDRMEKAYRDYVAKNGSISRDEYLGLLLRKESEISGAKNEAISEGKVAK